MTIRLRYIPLDTGGYDSNGRYYGIGMSLWSAETDDGSVDLTFRAAGERGAREYLDRIYPGYPVDLHAPEGEIDEFAAGYIDAAKWLSHGPEDGDDSTADEVSPSLLVEILRECSDFQRACAELLETAYETEGYDAGNAGHDFFLTRNGHGAGFWDRGLGETGEALTKMSKPYGETYYYVNDAGELVE